ncbi:Mu transposase C-terminal domain-containing protein [Mycobacteroides abscessus]
MPRSAAQLRIGDMCRYNHEQHELVALDGMIAQLRRSDGQLSAIKLSDLFCDKSFEVVTLGVRRRQLPPPGFEALSPKAQTRARWLEHHITEILDGTPVESAADWTPRPEYDPASTTIGDRERAKVAELEAVGTPLQLKVIQRYRRLYEAQGISAFVDRRVQRPETPTGRVDPRYIDALRKVLEQNTTESSRTEAALKWAVDNRVRSQYGGTVALPSRATFNRILHRMPEARHATGSARTRQTRAHQPRGTLGTLMVSRPGELMQIDSTPFDVSVRLDNSTVSRIELTILVDVATRSIASAVLRPTTNAFDATLLIAKSMTPELMRPGWPEAASMAASSLPYQAMRSVDDRLSNAAARPIINPENIVYDHGRVFISKTFRSACRSLGISLQPARLDTPTDKPIVERTLGSVKTLFAQYVQGYLGSSVEQRGKNADHQARFSLPELQELLDEWIIVGWQSRKHEGLRDPFNPQRVLTPNEKYASLLAVCGYAPAPLKPDEYIALMPYESRKIQASGITMKYRNYDCDELNELRGQRSGLKDGLWHVHYDPSDVSRVWVHHPRENRYITAYWRQLQTMPQPFGDAIWEHARRQEAARDQRRHTEESINACVNDLLQRASDPASTKKGRRSSTKDRRIVARNNAATHPASTHPDPIRTTFPLTLSPPEEDDTAVVPLPVFDAEKESQSW